MVKYTKSTYQILAYKALNRDIDEVWVDWAMEMMENGYNTEHLTILAGLSVKLMSQFYAQDVTSRVLQELNLDCSNQEQAIKHYAICLIDEVLAGREDAPDVLQELGSICKELDLENNLLDFYYLNMAYEGLHQDGYQCYWPAATRDNIGAIVKEYFKTWVEKHRGA